MLVWIHQHPPQLTLTLPGGNFLFTLAPIIILLQVRYGSEMKGKKKGRSVIRGWKEEGHIGWIFLSWALLPFLTHVQWFLGGIRRFLFMFFLPTHTPGLCLDGKELLGAEVYVSLHRPRVKWALAAAGHGGSGGHGGGGHGSGDLRTRRSRRLGPGREIAQCFRFGMEEFVH